MSHRDLEKKRTYDLEYSRRPEVKAHRSEYNRIYRQRVGDRLNTREAYRRLHKRAQCLVAHARIRARRKGLEFDLDKHVDQLQERIDRGVCELTGLPFDLRGGKRQWASPSIDRIDPREGYVFSNVRLIVYGMNAAMGNWGIDVLVDMVIGLLRSGNAIVPPLAEEFIRAYQEARSRR